MTKLPLFEIAETADNAWAAALEARYGVSASQARYDARGKATPALKALYDAKVSADKAAFSDLFGQAVVSPPDYRDYVGRPGAYAGEYLKYIKANREEI